MYLERVSHDVCYNKQASYELMYLDIPFEVNGYIHNSHNRLQAIRVDNEKLRMNIAIRTLETILLDNSIKKVLILADNVFNLNRLMYFTENFMPGSSYDVNTFGVKHDSPSGKSIFYADIENSYLYVNNNERFDLVLVFNSNIETNRFTEEILDTLIHKSFMDDSLMLGFGDLSYNPHSSWANLISHQGSMTITVKEEESKDVFWETNSDKN